jgi:hypothetical protein
VSCRITCLTSPLDQAEQVSTFSVMSDNLSDFPTRPSRTGFDSITGLAEYKYSYINQCNSLPRQLNRNNCYKMKSTIQTYYKVSDNYSHYTERHKVHQTRIYSFSLTFNNIDRCFILYIKMKITEPCLKRNNTTIYLF